MNNNKKQITNFALNPDKNTLKQFKECYKEDFVIKASLMPDAHSGYVAPIGSVLITKQFIVPAWVGYDIGCGMIACKFTSKKFSNLDLLNQIKTNSQKIYNLAKKIIPTGLAKVNTEANVSKKTRIEFKKIFTKFKEKEYNEKIYKFIKSKGISNLGSLGHGNHFIELGEDGKNNTWLVIHTGSRNIGHKIAEHYMKQASNKENDFEKTATLDENSLIGKEYLNSLNFCLDFALLNRLEIAYKIQNILIEVLDDKNITFDIFANKNHNHAIALNSNSKFKHFIHRKGTTPAEKGEKGVIPANMKDGSFLVEGLGNPKFLMSSSHGAGRVLSRTQARKEIKINEFKKDMTNITCQISKSLLDEAPKAYKNIYDVMEKQKESVKILTQIKPIINIKGDEGKSSCEK